MSVWQLLVGDMLVLSGVTALSLAIFGLIRVPSFFVKLHAATKGVVLGVALTLASGLSAGDWGIAVRALLVAAFMVWTAPAAAHALARRAYARRQQPQQTRRV